ncbi:MAG: M48 family metallopeptidase [Vicinamibacterales bacterium]
MGSKPLRQPELPFEQAAAEPAEAAAPSETSGASALRPSVTPPALSSGVLPHIEYVRHPRARRYLIRVRLDGTVRATIPRGGSKRDAVRFVRAQAAWILGQLTAAAQLRATRPPRRPAADLRAQRARARRELPARLLELAARFDLTVKKVSIRNQRWRWGSCSRQAHICLNWRLIEMPEWVRDYVLIHELMHLRRMDHSPAFWRHVAAACPEYREARLWLRRHGRGLSED